ncbi:hypothetical protein G9P44_006085 [Scheffersomyces stipitis]|nr:hypothetical protein G9P44_006085 [Scheffersomyces stipitis]
MKFGLVILTSLSVFSSLVSSYSSSSNLLQVNDKNFKEIVIDSGKFTFVDFYADWCRHCKNLMPTIEELADVFEPFQDQVQVVKINGDKDGKKMSKKYVFKGYPTMLLFHGNDEPVEYDGIRDLQALSNFVQQITGVRLASIKPEGEVEESKVEQEPTGLIRLNDINFEDKIRETPYSIVVFTATWCQFCQKLKPVLETLVDVVFANEKEKIQIAIVELDTEPGDKLSDRYHISTLPTILFFSNEYDEPSIYDGEKELLPLLASINEFTDSHRDVEGRLSNTAGRIQEVDNLISQKILQGFKGDLSTAGIELLGEISHLSNENYEMLPYYKKLVSKIINNEMDFFKNEFSRLATILENDISKLTPNTIDSMQKRSNILSSFI